MRAVATLTTGDVFADSDLQSAMPLIKRCLALVACAAIHLLQLFSMGKVRDIGQVGVAIGAIEPRMYGRPDMGICHDHGSRRAAPYLRISLSMNDIPAGGIVGLGIAESKKSVQRASATILTLALDELSLRAVLASTDMCTPCLRRVHHSAHKSYVSMSGLSTQPAHSVTLARQEHRFLSGLECQNHHRLGRFSIVGAGFSSSIANTS